MWLCPFLSPACSEDRLSSHCISFYRVSKPHRNYCSLLNHFILSDLSFYLPLFDPSLPIFGLFYKTAVFSDQLEVGCRNPCIDSTRLRLQLRDQILIAKQLFFGISLPRFRFRFPCVTYPLSNKVMLPLMRHFYLSISCSFFFSPQIKGPCWGKSIYSSDIMCLTFSNSDEWQRWRASSLLTSRKRRHLKYETSSKSVSSLMFQSTDKTSCTISTNGTLDQVAQYLRICR